MEVQGRRLKNANFILVVSSVVLSMVSVKLTAVMDHPNAEQPLDAKVPEGWR